MPTPTVRFVPQCPTALSIRGSYRFVALVAACLCFSTVLTRPANATIVEFQTVLGTFEVNLYDNGTPLTVANFLDYVQNGAYTDSILHRSVPGFVVQGGGFATDLNANITPIAANPAVNNEPQFSNVRGTIAMAKLDGNPNSATNQWFFNLGNNAANLDSANGGFTVFGEVTGNGMAVVDAIAALPRFNLGGALAELPLQNNFPGGQPDNTHLIIITGITVTDTTVNSAAGLNPPPNTANNGGGNNNGGGGGGGGGFAYWSLLALLFIRHRRDRVASDHF